jgi:myosin heavy subunit
VDNQPILDMLEKKPTGVLPLVDDECVVPKGSDDTLVEKLQHTHSGSAHWGKPPRTSSARSERGVFVVHAAVLTEIYLCHACSHQESEDGSAPAGTPRGSPQSSSPGTSRQPSDTQHLQFVVKHYAGPVLYTAAGFLSKNRDLLQPDVHAFMSGSASPFIQQLFPPAATGLAAKRGRAPTLGGQFRASLQQLYEKLTSTAPHFIKCVKTNEFKQPHNFASRYCLQQVEYLGLLEVVKIRERRTVSILARGLPCLRFTYGTAATVPVKQVSAGHASAGRQGYPVRRTPLAFVRRYALLDPGGGTASNDGRGAGGLLRKVGRAGLWQLGTTLVFMKDEQLQLLESARAQALDRCVPAVGCSRTPPQLVVVLAGNP